MRATPTVERNRLSRSSYDWPIDRCLPPRQLSNHSLNAAFQFHTRLHLKVDSSSETMVSVHPIRSKAPETPNTLPGLSPVGLACGRARCIRSVMIGQVLRPTYRGILSRRGGYPFGPTAPHNAELYPVPPHPNGDEVVGRAAIQSADYTLGAGERHHPRHLIVALQDLS